MNKGGAFGGRVQIVERGMGKVVCRRNGFGTLKVKVAGTLLVVAMGRGWWSEREERPSAHTQA